MNIMNYIKMRFARRLLPRLLLTSMFVPFTLTSYYPRPRVGSSGASIGSHGSLGSAAGRRVASLTSDLKRRKMMVAWADYCGAAHVAVTDKVMPLKEER